MKNKKIVIVGATSAIAEHCARLWIGSDPVEMILLGRNQSKLEPIAVDLRVRNPQANIICSEVNFTEADAIETYVQSLADAAPIDLTLIAHGALADQQMCQQQLSLCAQSLLINGVSPVLFAEAFAKQLEKQGRGTLVLIGSVAGDRGRKSNYIYGAAKGLMSRYAQGLQHRFAQSQVKIILVKPGPTDTPMTAHLKAQGQKLAHPAEVAQNIVDGVAKNKAVIYAPGIWKYIMTVICCIPNFIFAKMDI